VAKRPKTPGSGRKKGSLNKRTRFNVATILEQIGVSPVDEVLRILPVLEPRDQVRVWMQLQEYLEPKAVVAVDSIIPDTDLSDVPTEKLLSIVRND
jgi:hypothetical protein